jgi:hypothetical protein
MPWQDNLLTSRDAIWGLIHQTQRIAVLGIKTERQSFQPAFYVTQEKHYASAAELRFLLRDLTQIVKPCCRFAITRRTPVSARRERSS